MGEIPQAGRPLHIAVPTFRYNSAIVLQDIDLSVDVPGLVALLGPNGSGKSTLLRLAAGLLRSRDAKVSVCGRPLASLSPREAARWIAWVPQRAEPVFAMSVREMVRVGRYRVERPLRPFPPREEERIRSVLEQLGLAALGGREVGSLSGGEWQRALIARAVVQDAPVLLLDEPVASLDLRHQDAVYQLLRRLASEGRQILVADHHIEVAAAYAERAVLLSNGRIVADGTAEEVLTAEMIAEVFDVQLDVFPDPVTGSPRLSRPRGQIG